MRQAGGVHVIAGEVQAPRLVGEIMGRQSGMEK
jgi:hypothetical protein